MRFGLAFNIEDEVLIYRFIQNLGLNPKFKYYKKSKNLVQIRFASNRFIRNLEKHGIHKRKSKSIELPQLANRRLYLAFLLGYFDGDGKQGTSKIISGSLKFLEQIKKKFKIRNNIRKEKTKGLIDGYEFIGEKCELFLGAKLFNEILNNYESSLARKRNRFKSNKERISNIKKNVWASNEKKFIINENELARLVWEMPMSKIGLRFGVSGNTVKKECIKNGILTPPHGYWCQKKHNRNIEEKVKNLQDKT